MDTCIDIMSSEQLIAVLEHDTSGQMATTHSCSIQWNDGSKTKAFIKRFSKDKELALVNEVTGYIIAKNCDLPVPEYAGLIKTNPEHFGENDNTFGDWSFVVSELRGSAPGSFFALKDIKRCKALMDLVAGWGKVSDAIAFDDWVANEDRHLGNLLVAGKNRIYLFDHSNLPITLNWRADQLNPEHVAKSVLAHNLYQLNCTPLPVRSRVAHATSYHEDVYSNTKDELTYWWDLLLSKDSNRRAALENFISSRAAMGNQRVSQSLKLLA
ncbi:hypothetical protein J6J08_03615 [Pseudidiomarina sp. 1APR75-33.1]|uniref:HipA family kinase n=1 Tax=Pseudidiomarina terrestris TaxID=2820060 RepID=UPI00264E4566|nr:HipA family kinase [Pseudidiomarina sp. 1APR75-33.1]MDN7126464.1 hypothetical protein [Pseudidiomarina sp. 1APR75-33.1]